ncbi:MULTISPECIES: helix-turn-helix transcriptional regulator [Oligella]|uniref:Predicted transcriptional regulator n=1 Tax=Oligella urethralis TaxID=90245 RepID=A0A2X1WHK0_9BURK|nr:Predicted transcriptional regulator [Oligella urethralis]
MTTQPLLADIKDLQKIVKLGKTTIYDLIKKGEFPQPKRVGRRSLWDISEIQVWVESLSYQGD